MQKLEKSTSSVASTSYTSSIKCHRCHKIGHVQKDCPWAYTAKHDGGYISKYDVEEDIDEGPSTDHDQNNDRPSLGMDDAMDYWSIIVQ